MTWKFLYIQRQVYKGTYHWGALHIIDSKGKWEKLCYTYELPWKEYQSGPMQGKSIINESRIKIGKYKLIPRTGGPKGWRMELKGTGHRENIQIHRAHRSMFIEGCILPVHFSNFSKAQLTKGDPLIQSQSVALINKIKARYEQLSKLTTGEPLLEISANMPAALNTQTSQHKA